MIRPRASSQRTARHHAAGCGTRRRSGRGSPARCASRSRSTAGKVVGVHERVPAVDVDRPPTMPRRRRVRTAAVTRRARPPPTSQSQTPSSALSRATFQRASASRTAASARRRSVRSTSTPVMYRPSGASNQDSENSEPERLARVTPTRDRGRHRRQRSAPGPARNRLRPSVNRGAIGIGDVLHAADPPQLLARGPEHAVRRRHWRKSSGRCASVGHDGNAS